MLDNITPRTTLHYSGESTTLSKKSPFESVFPIVMIAVGIIGIYLMMKGG